MKWHCSIQKNRLKYQINCKKCSHKSWKKQQPRLFHIFIFTQTHQSFFTQIYLPCLRHFPCLFAKCAPQSIEGVWNIISVQHMWIWEALEIWRPVALGSPLPPPLPHCHKVSPLWLVDLFGSPPMGGLGWHTWQLAYIVARQADKRWA